jgi:hypothetical protein
MYEGRRELQAGFWWGTWKKDVLWKTVAFLEANIKMELKEIGLCIVDRLTDRPAVGSCEDGNEAT